MNLSLIVLRIVGGVGLSTIVITTTTPNASTMAVASMLGMVFICGAVAIGHLRGDGK